MTLGELTGKVNVDTVIREGLITVGMKIVNNGKSFKGYPEDLADKAYKLEVTEDVAKALLKAFSKDFQYRDLKRSFKDLGIIPKSSKNVRYFEVTGCDGEPVEVEEIDEEEYKDLKENNQYGDVSLVKSLCTLGSTNSGISNLNKVLQDIDLSTKYSIQVYDGKYLLVTDTPYDCETFLDLDNSEDLIEDGLDIFFEEPLKSIFYEGSDCLHLRIPLKKYNSLNESVKGRIDSFLEKNFSRAFLKYDSDSEELIFLGDMFFFMM